MSVDWDCGQIPSTTQNAPHELPKYVLVRHGHVPVAGDTQFCLMKTSYVLRTDHYASPSLKFWKFNVIEYPDRLIDGGELYKEDGIALPAFTYYIERDKTEVRPLGIYKSQIKRTNNYIVFPHLNYNDCVYEYTFTHPMNCLPPRYNMVARDKDPNEVFHFRLSKILEQQKPPSVAPPPCARIPQFVFHTYVSTAIEKKELCPITLEPFTKETVGCAPCGHLFDKDALRKALEANGKCPTCRQTATKNDIQTW